MATYNETVTTITATASVTASANLSMQGSVNTVTGTALLTADVNRTMQTGADSIDVLSTVSADAVYSIILQTITGAADMTAKSLKAIRVGLANGLTTSFVLGKKNVFS